jgi:hypothetical protein
LFFFSFSHSILRGYNPLTGRSLAGGCATMPFFTIGAAKVPQTAHAMVFTCPQPVLIPP